MLNNFKEHLRGLSMSEMTIRCYSGDISEFLAKFPEPSTVTAADIQSHIDGITVSHKPSTTLRKTAALRTFYKWLSRSTGSVNPFLGHKMSVPKKKIEAPVTISDEEIKQLINGMTSKRSDLAARDRAIFTLIITCGLRPSEVVSLKIENVDLLSKIIILRGERDRMLRIEDACTAIESYLNMRRINGEQLTPNSMLFINKSGKPLSTRSLRRKLEMYARRNNVSSRVSPRHLRHTYAKKQLVSGVNPSDVASRLGLISAYALNRLVVNHAVTTTHVAIAERPAVQISEPLSV